MLIKMEYLYLIITRKTIHKLKDNTSGIVIGDLIDIRPKVVVFWTGPIKVSEIDTNPNYTLFFW